MTPVIVDDFAAWWAEDGRFYDPDHEDISWYDKRKDLAEYAYQRGKLVTTRWQEAYSPNLISAAPEMLEALEACLPNVPGWNTKDFAGRPWLAQAEAAIQKARGAK